VLGRIAGQMIAVMFALLKKDENAQQLAGHRQQLPAPALYDATLHHQHRSGQHRASHPQPAQPQLTVVSSP
jgi:hypothetical protein